MRMPAVPEVEIEREVDGRWIADIPAMPGVTAYGKTEDEATLNVLALARRVSEQSERAST
jgi:predicted RNase H-like HicB family nuclease